MDTNLIASSISETWSCVQFEPVTVQARSIAIIAPGPSFRLANFVSLKKHVHIIAVKGAIHGLRRADSWITVDANRRTRQTMMDPFCRKAGTRYYAAVPEDFGQPDARLLWHRAPPEPDIHWLRCISGIGLSYDKSVLHTGNSAFAALGLAFHMGASRVALFGVDGTQGQYGIGLGRPRGSLAHLPALFSSAATQLNQAGILVKNAGYLPVFDRVSTHEAIAWLNDA